MDGYSKPDKLHSTAGGQSAGSTYIFLLCLIAVFNAAATELEFAAPSLSLTRPVLAPGNQPTIFRIRCFQRHRQSR